MKYCMLRSTYDLIMRDGTANSDGVVVLDGVGCVLKRSDTTARVKLLTGEVYDISLIDSFYQIIGWSDFDEGRVQASLDILFSNDTKEGRRLNNIVAVLCECSTDVTKIMEDSSLSIEQRDYTVNVCNNLLHKIRREILKEDNI